MAYGKSKITNPVIEYLELEPPTKEQVELLRYTSSQLKRVANRCVRLFLDYHERVGTAEKLRRNQPLGCPVPPDLAKDFYHGATRLCPDVSGATVLAVANWLAQTIKQQDSPRSNGKRCWQVLRYEESHWSFSYDLPIRLWTGNSKIIRHDGGIAIAVRLDRIVVPGKQLADSTLTILPLRKPKLSKATAGHRLAYLAACEIADGKRHYAQSQLVLERGKWMLRMTVNGKAPADASHRDANKVLVVRPGRLSALYVRGAGGLRGGYAEEALDRLAAVRAKLDHQRASIRKHLGTLPAHHAEHLATKWRNHATTVSQQVVTRLVKAVAGTDYGKVLWLDGNNRTAALALACRDGERDRRELFPFERMRKFAERKFAELGIEVVTRGNFRSVKRRKAEHAKRPKRERPAKSGAESVSIEPPLAKCGRKRSAVGS